MTNEELEKLTLDVLKEATPMPQILTAGNVPSPNAIWRLVMTSQKLAHAILQYLGKEEE